MDRSFLVVDVWFHIAKFLDLKKLRDIFALSKGIHGVVDSDLSWERRLRREFPPDQIHLFEENILLVGKKSLYKELKYGFSSNKSDKNPSFVTSKFWHRDYQNTKTVYNTELGYYSYDVEVENSRFDWFNRRISEHLSSWYSENDADPIEKPSITFHVVEYVPGVTEEDIEEEVGVEFGNLEDDSGRYVEIQQGIVRFQFFPIYEAKMISRRTFSSSCTVSIGTFIEEDQDKNEEEEDQGERKNNHAVPKELVRSSINRVFFANGVGMFILHPDDKSVENSVLSYAIGRELFSILNTTKHEILKNVIFKEERSEAGKKLLRDPIFDCKRDVFRGPEKDEEFYMFNFSFQLFQSEDGSDLEEKNTCGIVTLYPEFDEEAGTRFYRGHFKFNDETSSVVLDVFGSALEDYVTFSFVDCSCKETFFFAGGKISNNGKVTGFIFDPKKVNVQLHGVFTMTPLG